MSVTGPDVGFAIDLPERWTYVDLLDPDVADGAGPELGSVLAAARTGGRAARILMLRSLIAHTPEGEPLTAGLTVALADPDTPVASEPLGDLAGSGEHLSPVKLPAGGGVRLSRIVLTPPIGGAGKLRMLSVQYLLRTRQGLLTIGFTTRQASHPEAWERLFDAMAATAKLQSSGGSR